MGRGGKGKGCLGEDNPDNPTSAYPHLDAVDGVGFGSENTETAGVRRPVGYRPPIAGGLSFAFTPPDTTGTTAGAPSGASGENGDGSPSAEGGPGREQPRVIVKTHHTNKPTPLSTKVRRTLTTRRGVTRTRCTLEVNSKQESQGPR